MCVQRACGPASINPDMAASLCAMRSSQFEARHLSSGARKAGPFLNTDDVPDLFAGGARRKTAKPNHRQNGQPRRVLGAPMAAAMQPVPEHMNAYNGDWNSTDDCHAECELPWACSQCTFLNAGALKACEMCERPANRPVVEPSIGEQVSQVADRLLGNGCDSAWPRLAEADTTSWIDCDVSSVASSWLDVGTFEEVDDDDGSSSLASFICVDTARGPASTSDVSAAASTRFLSWAERATTAADASGGVVNAPQMRAPPLVQRQRQRVTVKSEENEDDYDPNDFLAGLPRFRRGSMQRHKQRR